MEVLEVLYKKNTCPTTSIYHLWPVRNLHLMILLTYGSSRSSIIIKIRTCPTTSIYHLWPVGIFHLLLSTYSDKNNKNIVIALEILHKRLFILPRLDKQSVCFCLIQALVVVSVSVFLSDKTSSAAISQTHTDHHGLDEAF